MGLFLFFDKKPFELKHKLSTGWIIEKVTHEEEIEPVKVKRND